MKKSKFLVLILVSFAIFLSDCAIHCDDFNNDIITWMPYQQYQKIMLTGELSSIELIVTFNEIDHTEKIGFGSKCDCMDWYTLSMESDSINLGALFMNSNNVEESYLEINGQLLAFSERNASQDINGKSYSDVISYVKEYPDIPSLFQKVIISKSIGILAVQMSNGEWLYALDSVKQIKISDVLFKSKEC